MGEAIKNMISGYEIEVVILALLVNLLTALIKKPIKAYGNKHNVLVGKIIAFIPVVLGVLLALAYNLIMNGADNLDVKIIISSGISSATLSLSFYALTEKLFSGKYPSSITKEEVSEAQEATDVVKNVVEAISEENCNIEKNNVIILKGKNEKTEIKEKAI